MKTKVFHVHLVSPDPSGESDFYFGSLAAIYTVLTADQIGCALGNLYSHCHAGADGILYKSALAVIRKDVLVRVPVVKKRALRLALLAFLAIFLIGCDNYVYVPGPDPWVYTAPYKYRIYNDWGGVETVSYIFFEKNSHSAPDPWGMAVDITLQSGEYSKIDSISYPWIRLSGPTGWFGYWHLMTADSVNIIKL